MANESDIPNEEHWRELFETADVNHDGLLNKDEVLGQLERMKIPYTKEQIELMIRFASSVKGESITFPEMLDYVTKQAKALRCFFDAIDKDHSGTLEPIEVQQSFEEMYHVQLPIETVSVLMERIGANSGHITFKEFKDFLMILPIHCQDGQAALQHIFDYWKDVASVDFGEGAMNMMSMSPKINISEIIAVLKQSYPSLAAGGIAGVVSRTCTAPLDRLKTIMQLQTEIGNGARFGSVVGGLRTIWNDGGMRGFFQGNGLNCAKILPESACKFFIYENVKRMLSTNSSRDLTIGQRFLAGSIAGAFSQLLVYPVDLLKTRIAASPVPLAFTELLRTTHRVGGTRAFYRGIAPSLLGMIPYAGIDLALYETFKNFYTRHHLNRSIDHLKDPEKQISELAKKPESAVGTIVAPLVCGTLSSAIAQLVAYPLSLVRTRMQAQGFPTALGHPAAMYTGMWDVFVKTVKKEGVTGLYKGLGPNYLKVIPSVSISYVVYENAKRYL